MGISIISAKLYCSLIRRQRIIETGFFFIEKSEVVIGVNRVRINIQNSFVFTYGVINAVMLSKEKTKLKVSAVYVGAFPFNILPQRQIIVPYRISCVRREDKKNDHSHNRQTGRLAAK